MSMGSVLGEYIHKHCKSKRAFAADIGFNENTIYKWCNDDRPIPIDKIALLAEYFHDLSGEPPNLFIFRVVLQEPTVRAVMAAFQQKQRDQK
jgi:transcriptional regulator with XRE-family HTH domain